MTKVQIFLLTSARTELWRVVKAKYVPEIQKRRGVCSSHMEYLRRKQMFRFKQFHVYRGRVSKSQQLQH
jgi:hypothetical protein